MDSSRGPVVINYDGNGKRWFRVRNHVNSDDVPCEVYIGDGKGIREEGRWEELRLRLGGIYSRYKHEKCEIKTGRWELASRWREQTIYYLGGNCLLELHNSLARPVTAC